MKQGLVSVTQLSQGGYAVISLNYRPVGQHRLTILSGGLVLCASYWQLPECRDLLARTCRGV